MARGTCWAQGDCRRRWDTQVLAKGASLPPSPSFFPRTSTGCIHKEKSFQGLIHFS